MFDKAREGERLKWVVHDQTKQLVSRQYIVYMCMYGLF